MSTQNERELAKDRLAKELSDAMDCTRVWDAWYYGTMSQDDFSLIAEDDERLNDIVEAVCAPLLSRIDALSKDAERWRFVRRKMCFIGNGDGTCTMQAINLPCAVKGWPEIGKQNEFCDAAIDAAISAREGE